MSDSEVTPLLRSTPARKSRFGHRLFAYTLIGLILLGTYELVFLARTSVARDWRHLHSAKFTLPEVERALVRGIDNASIAEWTDRYYGAGPHLAGQNWALAEWTRQKLEEFGFEAQIETYEVLLNYPAGHGAALLNGSDVAFRLSLEEDVLDVDPSTGAADRIPTFHGYSASGNATGRLVYANYGRRQDFERLAEHGIDLEGAIVLVRYGGHFRGLKVAFAEERGAAAVLIYSDPADDEGVTEKAGFKPYPEGPARQRSSVQRGSVQNLAHSPGDPTTPGWASKPGAPHNDEPQGIPGIPSIPISYADALPLLEALSGHGPEWKEWRGGLDGPTYAVGPSKLEVNVWSEQDYAIRPIYNVIARLEGATDTEVIVGNHRDAWVLGAADPNSGSAVLLELARTLGRLAADGWKPYRTIVLASWDAEEYGLVGSTEWGEDHAHHINKKTLAYLNLDVAFSGTYFGTSASPLLNEVIYNSTRRTPAPAATGNETLYELWASQQPGRGGHGGHDDDLPRIAPLGSGSDYTVFQDHIGVPSVDLGFSPGRGDAVYHYHSNYDSLHWQKTYGDTDFEYHAAVGRFLGISLTSLTDNLLIPFKVGDYAELLRRTIQHLLEDQDQEEEAAANLLEAADTFVEKAEAFDVHLSKLQAALHEDYAWYSGLHKFWLLTRIKIANFKLFWLERAFLHYDGLDNRPFFKHIVFAPGRYTGYAGQVLPGLAEAIEDHDQERYYFWVNKLHDTLRDVSITVSV